MSFVFSDICGHEYENKTRMLHVYEWFLFDEEYASLEWTISRTSQWYNLSFVLLLDWSSMNQGIQIHINMCLKILWSNFLYLCMVSQISITCYSYWVKYSNKKIIRNAVWLTKKSKCSPFSSYWLISPK